MAEYSVGTIVKDRYILKEYKGSGSFGEVWLAHDKVLDSDVAIKIYLSLDPRGIEEFKSEFITTMDISHPNLLTTKYFDVWEQHPFLVMKYCSKGSSSSQAGKMDEYALWQFIHDVAAGLHHLHDRPEPIIHQDIKPDNILMDDYGRFLITDFGISKKIRSTMRKLSKRAIGAGATAYMGPERFDSDPTLVKASDIWSLGVSIYELATGELPFSGMGGAMLRQGAELPALNNKWSKDLNMVMQSCLAKETWDRPTASQLEEFADAILKGVPAKITWTPPANKKEEPSEQDVDTSYLEDEEEENKKKKFYMALGVVAVGLLCLFLLWSTNKGENGTDPINTPTDTISNSSPKQETADNKSNHKTDKKETSKQATATVETTQTKIDKEAKTPTKDVPQPAKVEEPRKVEPPVIRKDELVKEESAVSESPSTPKNKAERLKAALAQGDYKEIQQLANQGYSPAYGPLAKFYLKNHDYKNAEYYAKKAGGSEGGAVLKALENLGYYD